ncbi:hypothetical protein NOCA170277 [metagenome]|uniref:Uncharacterized protein n=1 Tax=metagenome TaxID=256318 RepID=A0A2P2CK70_9ZZZZ
MPGASATATAAACGKRLDEPMTKVSKVYLGLSRVSSAEGRRSPCPIEGSGSDIAGGACSRGPTSFVDKAIDPSVDSSMCGGTSDSSAGLTVTSIRISRPKPSVRASSMWLRSRPSSWLRVKSLGTAMIAVFSCSVIGTLGRNQARWLGWRSSTICCHAVPRSTCWSSTRTAFAVPCLSHTGSHAAPESTELSTSCELIDPIAATGLPTLLQPAILPAFAQVRGGIRYRVTRVTAHCGPWTNRGFRRPRRQGT